MNEEPSNDALIPAWRGVYPKENFGHVFVIGLAGFAHSGKTTVAETILEELRREAPTLTTAKLSFATRIKEVLSALVGRDLPLLTPESKEAQVYGDSDWSVRDFMLNFGTGYVRKLIGDSFWLDIVAQQLSQLPAKTVAIIDDVRFPKEVDLVKSMGLVVLIERPGVERTIEHVSERAEELAVDATVKNDSTPEQAAEAVLRLVRGHPDWPA